MLYCLYYEKENLWREYFSNISRCDVSSILCYVSKQSPSEHLIDVSESGVKVKIILLTYK